ncbi:hypothetical protein CEXT_318691 [Caerostris extrusa]|uniref:Uncharacterized protein n=1 Tax=Caerostris extrusa TaxID=172846 RepID=A0AAV4TTC5_CAEEX|nr:hypothetical protein CEXT_318691 [Caerostris extrusa]
MSPPKDELSVRGFEHRLAHHRTSGRKDLMTQKPSGDGRIPNMTELERRRGDAWRQSEERKFDYPDREAKMIMLKRSDSNLSSERRRKRTESREAFSNRFQTWTRTIALLKGRSHECRQVTEEYRPNWKGGGCVGVGSLESLKMTHCYKCWITSRTTITFFTIIPFLFNQDEIEAPKGLPSS